MIRVAGYCRVSTDKEDQQNSFDSQCRFFREYIKNHPDWELHDIYADEGITGTSTRKRIQFNRMMNDAMDGKFHRIITKEVSRFSRNILDTIRYTRELKELGIGVIFLTDGFSTLDPDAELRLSIMGSIAQEESRKTSARVKWGQTRRMEQGVVFGRSMLGYEVNHGCLSIEPEGADLVRLIFQKYGIEKKGPRAIARELQAAGYRTYTGNPKWSAGHIIKILKNEKYAGDLIQKKTYTPDYLTHAKKTNHGEEEMVVIREHHPPIVSRELWELVQKELSSRDKHSGGHSSRYTFSGKIKCGVCGASFVSRQKKLPDGTKLRRWSCATAVNEGSRRGTDVEGNRFGCDIGVLLRDDDGVDMLRQVLSSLRIDRMALVRSVASVASEAIRAGERGGSEDPERLRLQIQRITQRKADMLDGYFAGDITKEDMHLLSRRYDDQIGSLRQRLEISGIRTPDQLRGQMEETLLSILRGETGSELLDKCLLDHVTVRAEGSLELRLKHLPHIFRFRRQITRSAEDHR